MTLQGDSLEMCHFGDQFAGEGLALFVALVAAIPLAALGIGLALSPSPSRWTRPWIGRATRAALIAQGGCLAASLLFLAILGDMPLLLHTALNIAGIVGWRRVAEALPAVTGARSFLEVAADQE